MKMYNSNVLYREGQCTWTIPNSGSTTTDHRACTLTLIRSRLSSSRRRWAADHRSHFIATLGALPVVLDWRYCAVQLCRTDAVVLYGRVWRHCAVQLCGTDACCTAVWDWRVLYSYVGLALLCRRVVWDWRYYAVQLCGTDAIVLYRCVGLTIVLYSCVGLRQLCCTCYHFTVRCLLCDTIALHMCVGLTLLYYTTALC